MEILREMDFCYVRRLLLGFHSAEKMMYLCCFCGTESKSMEMWDRVGEKVYFCPIFKQLGNGYMYCIKMTWFMSQMHFQNMFDW